MRNFYIDQSMLDGVGCFTRYDVKVGDKFMFTLFPMDNDDIRSYLYRSKKSDAGYMVLSEFTYCNHSDEPNFEVQNIFHGERLIQFVCIKDVDMYNEITLDYGKSPTY